MTKINTLRRIIQIISFFLIVYTSFFIIRQIDTKLIPFVEPPANLTRPNWYNPATKYVEVFDTYLPVDSCRFISGQTRLFRACFLHFSVEAILWASPLQFVLVHAVIFLALCFILGRLMCGWVCPLGFISEVLSKIREKIGIPRIRLSDSIIKFLSNFKYFLVSAIFLVTIAIMIPTVTTNSLQTELSTISCSVCPARIIFPLLGGKTSPAAFSFDSPIYITLSVIGISFLLFYLFGAFSPRAWCKICPSGTLISIFNKGSLLTMEKNVRKCNKCGTCKRVCPMQIKKVYEERNNKNVDSPECIRCFSCIDHCPEADCLKVKFIGKTIFKSGKTFRNKKLKIKGKDN